MSVTARIWKRHSPSKLQALTSAARDCIASNRDSAKAILRCKSRMVHALTALRAPPDVSDLTAEAVLCISRGSSCDLPSVDRALMDRMPTNGVKNREMLAAERTCTTRCAGHRPPPLAAALCSPSTCRRRAPSPLTTWPLRSLRFSADHLDWLHMQQKLLIPADHLKWLRSLRCQGLACATRIWACARCCCGEGAQVRRQHTVASASCIVPGIAVPHHGCNQVQQSSLQQCCAQVTMSRSTCTCFQAVLRPRTLHTQDRTTDALIH
jgi:hypothetical protein